MIQFNYSTIVTFILPSFIVLILILYVYLKLSYGFWFYAPVFHLYDFHYYLYPKGVVENELPVKNKFTNLSDIKMYSFDKVQNTYLFQQFVSFIGSHYMRNKQNNFLPTIKNTEPYFTNHKHPSFISYYYKTQLLQNHRNNNIISRKQIIAIMTTRPVQIQIKKSASSSLKMYSYYVDYLCVHKHHRNKGIAPQQIQTHYYHQRRMNPDIHVNLFKREGKLTGIVPLCVYSTYLFETRDLGVIGDVKELPIIYKQVRCSPQSMRHLTEFMKQSGENFEITISPDLSNIMDLIKSETYYIDYIVDTTNHNEIIACYVFKETNVISEKTKNVLACIASVKSQKFDPELFYTGFIYLILKFSPTYPYLLIESLSHNIQLCDKIKQSQEPVSISPTAYFFHNYVHPTFSPSKVLILGT